MKGKKLVYMALLTCALPMIGVAQEPAPAPTTPPLESDAPVGGKSALDFIRIDTASPSIPLRNPGVIRNSELVDLDGRILKRGTDYTLDYPSGMLLLMTSIKPGQTLRVSYRHDPAEAKTGGQKFGQGWNALKLSFGQGTTVMMGLGMAERGSDGSVMRSDLYAMRNSFGLAPGSGLKMNGMFAYSSRQSIRSQSLMGDGGAETGSSQAGTAIVQELGGKIAGGDISLQYQSIDRNFTGFAAFAESGYSQQSIDQLTKERGLKRIGLSMQGIQAGSLKLSQNYQVVGEKGNSIRTQSFGVQGKGWALNFDGRKVDQGFTRFRDLRETDRELLQREAGLETQQVGFQYDQRGTKFNASQFGVNDASDRGVMRTQFGLETGMVKLGYRTQSVDAGFNRFQGVRQSDAGQLAREQGISRRALTLDFKSTSKGIPSIKFNSSSMAGEAGEFEVLNLSLTGSNWTYDRSAFSNDAGFDGPGRQSEGEMNENIARIAAMYEPTGVQTRPEDRQWFGRNTGISRSSQRITFSPGRGIGFSASDMLIGGANGTGRLTSFAISAPTTKFSYRHQSLGENLVEVSSLMGFERERLGSLVGLSKTDMAFSTKFGKAGTVEASQMSAQLGDNEASRRSFRINDPKLQISYVERSVDPQFFNVTQLVDPEREMLGQMIGQEQRQLLVNVMLMRGLNVRMNMVEAQNDSLAQKRSVAESLLAWDLDKDTKLQWYRYSNQWTDPGTMLLDQSIDRLLVSRNFTGLGAVSFEREMIENGGETTDAPDSTRNSFTAEAQLNDKTSLRTEQSRTEYSDGNRETVSAHTVSTGLIKNAGVSVTDVNIQRTGDRPNERRRNYGFWVNLGGGVKFTYGYARELGQNGTLNSTMSLTGGEVGGLAFGGANYQHQRWDDQRDKSTGNFKIGTSKPVQLGFLKDFRFNVGTDTVRDYNAWQRDSQIGSMGGRIGDLQLGFDYTSQIHQSGQRAVDRSFRVATSNDPKRKLAIDAMIKLRTMPFDQQYMIRNVSLTGRFIRGFDLTYQTQTYPEQQRGDALLGSVVQPIRTVAWKLNQNNQTSNTRFGFNWEERINEQTRQMSRIASVSMTLNAKNPSPLRLSYGLEQGDQAGIRRTMHRYAVEFSQRPGPNQMFNFSAGNVSWQRLRDTNLRKDNWTFRMEYQLRF